MQQVNQIICSVIMVLLLTLKATIVFGQKNDISMDVSNTNIKEVFSIIQKQSDYSFFYNEDIIDTSIGLSLNFNNKDIHYAINAMENRVQLSFRILEDRMIVVSKKDSPGFDSIVKGRVVSLIGNEPLPGVNIFFKGTTTGVITDFDGFYEITVPGEEIVLVFSFVGFERREITVSGGQELNLALKEVLSAIDEVVITALNISRDRNSLGYSVSVLGGDQLVHSRENNMINALTGKVAGLQISQAASGVDGSTRVVLRGISSLLGNNRPLIVIDGLPMQSGFGGAGQWGGYDMGDALSNINPEDIESVSVLKGAGAAAAYGSRGANGVILFTTKKGRVDKGLGITVSSGYSFERPMVYPDLQNVYGQGSYGVYPQYSASNTIAEHGFPWGFSWGPKMEGQVLQDWTGKDTEFVPQPNNFRDFFTTGYNLTNTVAFESAGDISSFRASLTNQQSQGIVPTNNLDKNTFNLRGTSVLQDLIEVDGRVTYVHTNVNDRPYLTESSANHSYILSIMPRNIQLEDLRDNMADSEGREQIWVNDVWTSNPYWQMENVRNSDEKHNMNGVMSMKVNFSDNLSFLVRTGMDYSNLLVNTRIAPGSPYAGIRGHMSNMQSISTEINSDALLSYNTELLPDIDLILNGGGNRRRNRLKSIGQSGTMPQVPGFFAISNMSSFSTSEGHLERKVYSLFTLGQISAWDYLYYDFSVRNDWSSTLPLENNSYLYHSSNLSFLFTKAFNIQSDILSSGKIRGSFAKVGNDTSPYSTKQYYTVIQSQLDYPLGSFSSSLPFSICSRK